jgi:hypothetical protein
MDYDMKEVEVRQNDWGLQYKEVHGEKFLCPESNP